MTDSSYARDLRVIQWPQQDVSFSLVDDDGRSWLVTPSTEQGQWWGADPAGEVWHDGATADEVIHAIIGGPQLLDLWQVEAILWLTEGLAEGQPLRPFPDGPDFEELLHLLARHGLIYVEDVLWYLTAAGAAKAAMLS